MSYLYTQKKAEADGFEPDTSLVRGLSFHQYHYDCLLFILSYLYDYIRTASRILNRPYRLVTNSQNLFY